MALALSFPRQKQRAEGGIWLGDVDPDGRPLHPHIKELGYQKQSELARYRANEMSDQAEVASLIEEAIYRTSRAASERAIADPAGYLSQTYTNLVDQALRRTVKAFGMEDHVLAALATTGNGLEEALVNKLTRQQLIQCMDEKGRGLWEKYLLGYDIRELAAAEGQSTEYLGKRLRRAVQRVIRKLTPSAQPEPVSDNTVAHG